MTPQTSLGRDVFFRYLVHQGVEYMFGNPGSTELALVDGCNDYPIEYVLSLHEDVAVAQAMGYARGSGKVGVVNLHVAPGIAHGLGNLYNAFRARVPLLVTAGQHHTGLLVQDPILTADLVGMVAPFTKWAYDVRFLEELPIVMQRAFKELATPPFGPVFLAIAPNLLLEPCADTTRVAVSRVAGQLADDSGIAEAARVLEGARAPIILAGDGVGHAGAWQTLASIAETVGAGVYTEGYSTLWNFPADHPLYLGPMPNRPDLMRARFDGVDVALLCGVTSQAPVSRYDDGGPLVPFEVETIAVDDSPWELGKNHPATVGLLGDVGANLERLQKALTTRSSVGTRMSAISERAADRRAQWERRVQESRTADRLTPVLVAAELRDRSPEGTIYVDESISNRPNFVNVLSFADPQSYFAANGVSLGYSAGVAAGLHLAHRDRRIVNIVGDGSLLYYPHALWNAASSAAPILFVVLNNGSYRVLKLIVERMGGPWGEGGAMPPGLDLAPPGVDFVALAGAVGVSAERVATPTELGPALARGLSSPGPYLVDVALDQSD